MGAIRLTVLLSLVACSQIRQAAQETSHTTQQQPDTIVTAVIPPEGGIIELEGVARANFPAGAFDAPQLVRVFTTNTPETEAAQINWNWSSDSPTPPLSYDVRINSGDVRPATVFEVVLTVPDEYLSEVPPGDTPHVFAQVVGGGRLENLDFYQVLASEFDAGAKEVRAQVPLHAVRPPRVDDGTIEVIVVVGSAPQ